MGANHVIAFDRVSKRFITKDGENQAVDDISFTVSEGEFVSILGPSGCGKSTLLSMLSGLFQPTKGKIMVNNQIVNAPCKEVGYMLQQDYLLGWRTIKQNILLGLEIQGTLTRESEKNTLKMLSEMGLLMYKDHFPNQLSGGMRQRVALVRTLATNPQILLLDEPFSALDFQTKLRLEDLVIDTLRRKKKTAVLVTHDISEAVAMSDRIVVLKSSPGKVATIIDIPDSLREPLPFDSRELQNFKATSKKYGRS